MSGPGQAAGAIREHHLSVRRSARYATLGEPGTGVRELWLVCHGYRQLAARFLRAFQPIAGEERWIVAPEGLSRFYVEDQPGPHGPESRVGASWMTREDRLSEIADYIDYLDDLHDHLRALLDGGTVRVCAFGFSQGGATAARWAVMGRTRPDHLVLWSSFLPPDLDRDAAVARLRGMDVTLAVGERDPLVGGDTLARQRARMADWGIDHRLIRFDGGHRVEAAPLVMVSRRHG